MTIPVLDRVRSLNQPTREATLERSPSAHRFWDENRELLIQAWAEWESVSGDAIEPLNRTLYDQHLLDAVEAAWEKPELENLVKNLWQEVLPGVYTAQFFNPQALGVLRAYLEKASHADIPLRPPYGIALNRGGAMLDPRSEGYLAAPSFQAFYQELVDAFMRPISRLLFPEVMGYDTQTFGFSIQWQANKDTSLRPHTDASSVTLNINLNLPGERYEGSSVSFFDRQTGVAHEYTFEPGSAVIHRGDVPHASQPITHGERSNFVLWLYGDQGRTPSTHLRTEPADAHERWVQTTSARDGFAPF